MNEFPMKVQKEKFGTLVKFFSVIKIFLGMNILLLLIIGFANRNVCERKLVQHFLRAYNRIKNIQKSAGRFVLKGLYLPFN